MDLHNISDDRMGCTISGCTCKYPTMGAENVPAQDGVRGKRLFDAAQEEFAWMLPANLPAPTWDEIGEKEARAWARLEARFPVAP